MSCIEITCIENIVDIQATYCVINLSLSNLIEDVITELQKGFLPILEIRLFLHSLKSVALTNETEGQRILDKMTMCMRNQLYLSQSEWTTEKIMKNITKLQRLILYDYMINGSIVYSDNEIIWDVNTSFILHEGKVEIYTCAEN